MSTEDSGRNFLNTTFAVRDHHPFEGLLFPEGATARAAAERRTRYPRLIVARSLIIFISFAVTPSLIHEITTVATGFLFPATIPYLLHVFLPSTRLNRQQRVVTDIEGRTPVPTLVAQTATASRYLASVDARDDRWQAACAPHTLVAQPATASRCPASVDAAEPHARFTAASRPGCASRPARCACTGQQRAASLRLSREPSPCSPARGDKRRVLRRASGRARCAHLRQHTPRRVGKARSTC